MGCVRFRKKNKLSFTHEMIREFQSSNPGRQEFQIVHKMASLTCIYDKQGVHNVLGRVPGPRRVIVQNANK